jgi:lysophospholipase L1-like esterase
MHQGALVFSFGINDTAREADGRLRVEPGPSIASARRILAEAKAWKPTLMIGPTQILRESLTLSLNPGLPREVQDARIAAASSALAALCAELGVPYLDLFAPLSADPRFAKSIAEGDGIHPTAPDYAVMADLIGRWPAWRKWFDG